MLNLIAVARIRNFFLLAAQRMKPDQLMKCPVILLVVACRVALNVIECISHPVVLEGAKKMDFILLPIPAIAQPGRI